MWKQFVKDYLSFSKKERNAALVLLVLIVMLTMAIYMLPAHTTKPPTAAEAEKFRKELAALKQGDSVTTDDPPPANGNESVQYESGVSLFYFDPNTLSPEGWKKLGLRDKTIQTIRHYIDRGGKFKKPEDLGKIYGLFKNDYERLKPYVRINLPGPVVQEEAGNNFNKIDAGRNIGPEKKIHSFEPVDINDADTTSLIALPGIGSKLAARIVGFRQKLGGFYSIDQIAETYGLPDSTFQQLRPRFRCDHPSIQKININTADINTLKQHPYIKWTLANAIVQYRGQHGRFASVDDIRQIASVTELSFQKLKYYLTVDE